MRKTIILLFSVILFSACGPSEDNKAQKYLDAMPIDKRKIDNIRRKIIFYLL